MLRAQRIFPLSKVKAQRFLKLLNLKRQKKWNYPPKMLQKSKNDLLSLNQIHSMKWKSQFILDKANCSQKHPVKKQKSISVELLAQSQAWFLIYPIWMKKRNLPYQNCLWSKMISCQNFLKTRFLKLSKLLTYQVKMKAYFQNFLKRRFLKLSKLLTCQVKMKASLPFLTMTSLNLLLKSQLKRML